VFSLDLTDTADGLIPVKAAFNLPFCVWIRNAYFASIPRELEEAAWLDGTGRLGSLTRVVTSYHEQWQYLFATSIVAIVPVVVLFVFVERYLVAGLTAGGVRG
jgi:multiple sugar transport system permease protein